MTIIYRIFAVFGYLFKTFRFAFKSITTTIITVLFIGSLLINIAMLSWTAGALAISGVFSAVTGTTAVVTKMQNVVKKTTNRVVRRTVRVVVRNTSSTLLEWVPFAGALVSAGFLVYEGYDACETVKDMDELNTAVGNDVENNNDEGFFNLQKYCSQAEAEQSENADGLFKRWWKKLPFTKN